MEKNVAANTAKPVWQLRQRRAPRLFIIMMSFKNITRRCWLVLYGRTSMLNYFLHFLPLLFWC